MRAVGGDLGARRILLGVGALGLIAAGGCAQVLGLDTNRQLTPDAGADAGPLDRWDCLGAPPEPLDPTLNVEVTLVVMDATQNSTAAGAVDGGSDLDTVTGTWLPGVTARQCTLRDLDCTSPQMTAVTNDAGQAKFHMTGDFAGFFRLDRPDLVPAALYPGNLLAGQTTVSFPAYGIRPFDFTTLALVASGSTPALDPDGGLGHLIVTIYDCQDHQAPGVSVTYDSWGPDSDSFYFTNGLPDRKATQTDSYGLAGATNVPIGSVTAKAYLNVVGKDAGSLTEVGMTTVDVRPGALTFAWIRTRSH
jgi:hypothetical protein